MLTIIQESIFFRPSREKKTWGWVAAPNTEPQVRYEFGGHEHRTVASLAAEASASSIDRYPVFKPFQSSTTFLRLRGLLTEKKCFKKNLSASESSSNEVEYLSCRTKILRASNMKSPWGIDFSHLRARSETSATIG